MAGMDNDSYMSAEAVSSLLPPCEAPHAAVALVKHDDELGEEARYL